MRITVPQEVRYPNGERYLRIAAGPGMLRKIRQLVAAQGCPVEAISRRGKIVARGGPPMEWWPRDSYYMVCYMTSGGVGRHLPRLSSFNRPRSGARKSSSWKESESVLRRKRAREHLQRQPTLPERLDAMAAKMVRGDR